MKEFEKSIISGVISTVIGGVVLTFMLFAFDEWLFPAKNLTGEWTIKTVTKASSYSPFINVKQEFKFELLQKGADIVGSGEKVKEINADDKVIDFKPEKRVRLEVTGYLQRNYIRDSKIYLNIIEHGERATSTTTFFLTFLDKENLSGNFISTVSNSKGTIILSRDNEKF